MWFICNNMIIYYLGAIIFVDVQWNCDFDYDERECDPDYKWYRLDGSDDTITHGYNFRTAIYDFNGEYDERTLRKFHGIRIIFVVSGQGGKFDILTLTITLGAGIAYIGIASLITDIVLSNFLEFSYIYSSKKTKTISKKKVE